MNGIFKKHLVPLESAVHLKIAPFMNCGTDTTDQKPFPFNLL
jgi:hypothetical protein